MTKQKIKEKKCKNCGHAVWYSNYIERWRHVREPINLSNYGGIYQEVCDTCGCQNAEPRECDKK